MLLFTNLFCQSLVRKPPNHIYSDLVCCQLFIHFVFLFKGLIHEKSQICVENWALNTHSKWNSINIPDKWVVNICIDAIWLERISINKTNLVICTFYCITNLLYSSYNSKISSSNSSCSGKKESEWRVCQEIEENQQRATALSYKATYDDILQDGKIEE